MGSALAWKPLWFAPNGERDEFSWRRSTDFEHVGTEGAVRESVGLTEISTFAKYSIEGPAPQPGWTGCWPANYQRLAV